MSVQRTPPGGSTISGSGGASGSAPDLSTCIDIDQYSHVSLRKRKERTEVSECKSYLESFRTEIMKFLEDFGKKQNENLTHICEEISDIKTEIKTIKLTTENFTKKFESINNEIQNIKSAYSITENKIRNIESELSNLKIEETLNPSSKSPALVSEDLVIELKDRCDREKNIVIVGISEKNDNNYNSRRIYDEEEVFKVLKSMYEDCPKPINCIRLGKYIANKNRPIKVFFENSEVTKYLLRNKTKLPENIQVYSDQTPMQRRYLQSLKEVLNMRKSNGETDLIIKYVKGKPTIVTNKTNKKN